MKLFAAFLFVFFTMLCQCLSAQPQTFEGVTVNLLPAHHSLAPGQTSTQAILHFQMQGNWHVYWQNPGDVGLQSRFAFALPPGWQQHPPQWPTPKPFLTPPDDPLLMSYGYANEVYLSLPLTLPATTAPGTYPLPLTAEFLICEDICLPITTTLTTQITVDTTTQSNPQLLNALSQQTYPQPAPFTPGVETTPTYFHISLPPDILANLNTFIPAQEGLIDDLAPQTTSANTLTLQRDAWADTPPTTFAGLFLMNNGTAWEVSAIPLPPIAPADPPAPSTPDTAHSLSFTLALFFAFLAGLILNIMPCVLPVLTLKLFHLFRHPQQRLSHALAYSTGVISCFLSLATLLILLRQSGLSLGWGFHLQSAPFVFFLILLLSGVAYSIWRPLPLPALFLKQLHTLGDTRRGSFALGVLITIIASPCTVPFMGGALAYALTSPATHTVGVMATMGVGMALPFLIAALLPHPPQLKNAHLRWLKPILAIPVFLTAIWLFTIWLKLIGLTQPHINPGWQPWSHATVQQLQTQNRAILVNATADWCLTCKVTEQTLFTSTPFKTWVQTHNIALLEADWTRQDPAITTLLNTYQREGVPLYLFHHNDEVTVLPQLPQMDDLTAILP